MRIARHKALRRHGRILLVACLIAGLNAPGAMAAGTAQPGTRPATLPGSPLLVPGAVYTRGGANRAALVEGHIQAARALEAAGQVAAAEARLAEALRLDPRNRKTYTAVSNLYYPDDDRQPDRRAEGGLAGAIGNYYLGRHPRVVSHLDDRGVGEQEAREMGRPVGRPGEYDPPRVPAHLLVAVRVEGFTYRGLAKAAMGDHAGAMVDFDKAAGVDASSPRPHVARAEVHAAADDVPAALASYRRAIEVAPDAPTPYFSRGLMYLEGGNLEAALEDLNRVVELMPRSFDARLARGMTLTKLRRGKEALADFEAARRLEPANDNLYAERARAHHVNGVLVEARADCELAIVLNPNNARAYLHRGLIELGQTGLTAAFADLAVAVRLSHEAAHVALRVAEDAMAAEPARAEAYHLRGLVRLRSTDRLDGDAKAAALAEALADLQRYFKLGGTSAEGHYDLGLCLAWLGRHKEANIALDAARKAYAKIVWPGERMPRGVNPHLAAAYSFHALGWMDDARKACDAAVAVDPQNPQAFKWRGLVRRSLDDLARADELSGRTDPEVWYLMALAHLEAARNTRDYNERSRHLADGEVKISEATYYHGGYQTKEPPHHRDVRHQVEAQQYYMGYLGARSPEGDRRWAEWGIQPWPKAVKPGEPAAAATPAQGRAGTVDKDKTGTYVLLGLGALMLANELLRDQEPAAATGNEKPRPKRTFPCPDCGGTGEATIEGHRVFNDVPGPSMSFGPCLRCDGIGKLPPLW